MNTDIRISISFKNHRKRKKFQFILGVPDATDYLLDFWLTAAVDRPEGDLSGLDNMDIALMAGWRDDPDHFVRSLIKAGFLDETETGLVIHDWEIHNGYASAAKKRSEAARKAAKEKWNRRLGEGKKCDRNAPAEDSQCDRNAPARAPSPTPTPTPTPTPIPNPNPNPNPNPTPTTTEPPHELVDELIQSCLKVSSSSEAQFTSTVRFLQQMYHECPEVVERALMHFQANSNGKWKAGTLTDICRKKAEEIIQEQDSKPKPIEDELEQYKRSKILEEFDKRIRDFPHAPDPKLYITNRENYRSIHNRESVQIIGKEQWQKYSNLLKSKGIDPRNPPRGQPIGKTA